MPSLKTNCIDDWETKVNKIVEETIDQNMTLISGIPSWVQMYFERLLEVSGKSTVKEVFPNFSLFVYGGVNFEPYRNRFNKLIGEEVDSIELFPASEGFFAYQDTQTEEGLLLELDSGIFYEFIPSAEFYDENPTRISLKDVQVDVNYVMLISTCAGLWAYNVGDTIKFISTDPYRIIVTGRIKHFISAFGEHVIAEEVEYCMQTACKNHQASITEFTVAPQVNPEEGELPYHEWIVEFDQKPANEIAFRKEIDHLLRQKNIYYNDLLEGKVLQSLRVTSVAKGSFKNYMKSIGKLGGQNKVARLSNDREIADKIIAS